MAVTTTTQANIFLLALLLAGCTNRVNDCHWNATTCPGEGGTSAGGDTSSGDGGAGGDSGSGGTSTGDTSSTGGTSATCDTTASPSEESCLVANKYAVFVSPDGNDDDDGTQATPVKTIAKALDLAAGDKAVVACSGAYDESLVITDGAKIYGSFDCANEWTYDASNPTIVAPTAEGVALSVVAVTATVAIEDVQFAALDATVASASSIAAFVKDSTNVKLRGVTLTAGNGAAGETPTMTGYTFDDATTLIGNAGEQYSGGAGTPCMCPNASTTTRGGGGAPTADGGTGLPTYDTTSGLGGDTTLDCGAGGSGLSGADAPTVAAAVGATSLGIFANDTWTPSSGTAGSDGQPGQGGGGGAGKTAGGGGSGACGGCGGQGGPAGTGGGASIALLSVNSTVTLRASTLVTANGGVGAAGAAGHTGQAGGIGGDRYGDACLGGNGGTGAAGATGGGGAGGLSVGIFYSGTAPTADTGTTIALGQAGIGGIGGDTAGTTDDGMDGTAAETLAIP